jgi:hypothetical protein
MLFLNKHQKFVFFTANTSALSHFIFTLNEQFICLLFFLLLTFLSACRGTYTLAKFVRLGLDVLFS